MLTASSNLVGQTLGQGRYQVKRQLGEGGMAFALLALDKTLGADVVLKVPKPIILADPEFGRRFRREIRSMLELTHEHIVKIKDVGEHDGMPFYVMDLLAGGSLLDRFEMTADRKQKPMPPESLADWLAPVASALDFIHQRFVHRDIKPANILFDADGAAYVSDFGIVKAIADGSDQAKQTVMTQAGMVLGTGPYMAPELSEGGKVDGRADQYALAATVYQTLSGRVPFEGTTLIEIIKKQLLGQLPPLHEVVPALPRSLTQVVERGLSLEAKDRYATCTAFARAVLAAVKTIPATAAAKPRKHKAVCPACRAGFALPPDPAGKRVTCPGCGASFTVAEKAKPSSADTNKASLSDTRKKGARPAASTDRPQIPMARHAPPAPGKRRAKRALLLSVGGIFAVGFVLSILLVACAGVMLVWKTGDPPKKGDAGPGQASISAPPGILDCTGPTGASADRVATAQKEWAEYLNLPVRKSVDLGKGVKVELVLIPPGRFMMGSPPEEKDRRDGDRELRHEVEITKAFYMGVYTVTQEQYEAAMGSNPSGYCAQGYCKDEVAGIDTRRFPVELVTWYEAKEFCGKLAAPDAQMFRLPSEAEWEYACRAGTTTPFHFGETITADQANFGGKPGLPTPVGKFPANSLGLCDMHGNVWQWCEDWYAKDYYKRSPKTDPLSLAASEGRAVRGGPFLNGSSWCRAANRDTDSPAASDSATGFRVVLCSRSPGKGDGGPEVASKSGPPGILNCTGTDGASPERAKTGQCEWADYLKLPVRKSVSLGKGVKMELILIPPGRFMMGSPPDEKGRWPGESEFRHEVEITKAFYMGVYTVTQEEYEAVVGSNPSSHSSQGGLKDQVAGIDTRRFPVESVSWNKAKEFCGKLAAPEGKVFRLPSEAEWEYACRAGTTTPFHFGEKITADEANFKGAGPGRAIPVGKFAANAFGLCDMHGNVRQWCEDWYGEDFYKRSPKADPLNLAAGEKKANRGGSYFEDPGHCRAAFRNETAPGKTPANFGFRVVLCSR